MCSKRFALQLLGDCSQVASDCVQVALNISGRLDIALRLLSSGAKVVLRFP